MESKTLADFKNKVASTFRNSDGSPCNWDDFKSKSSTYQVLQWLQIAAELYAAHVAEQACRKQRELCADAATVSHRMTIAGKYKFYEVNTDSILNAPLATENKI